MKIVVTKQIDKQIIKCQFCDKEIARLVNYNMNPSPEQCYKSGNIPVPNFGWFCSQDCATKYEQKFEIHFQHNSDGKIDYYSDK